MKSQELTNAIWSALISLMHFETLQELINQPLLPFILPFVKPPQWEFWEEPWYLRFSDLLMRSTEIEKCHMICFDSAMAFQELINRPLLFFNQCDVCMLLSCWFLRELMRASTNWVNFTLTLTMSCENKSFFWRLNSYPQLDLLGATDISVTRQPRLQWH